MATQGKQLSQTEIYKILETYIETNSKCITADYLDLRYETVDKYIKENSDILEELSKRKKEEMLNSVLEFDKSLSKLKNNNIYLAQQIMNKGLKKDANIGDAVKVYGVIMDKEQKRIDQTIEANNEPIIVRVDTTDKSELNDKLRVRFEKRCEDEPNKND